MATKTTADQNFYENWVDSQKKAIDNMTESASKFTTDKIVNETIEKGSDIYKSWLDKQLSFMNEQTERIKESKSNLTPEQAASSAKHWMELQMKTTQEFMEFSMSTLKSYMESTLKAIPQLSGKEGDTIRNSFNENMSILRQWNDTLNKSFDEMLKYFDAGVTKDTMKGMMNMTESYNKFVELWMPFVKSMQEKSFNADAFKNMMNTNVYQEMFNKVFNYNSNPFSNWTNMLNNPSNNWMNNWNTMMNPSQNPFNAWSNWSGMWNTSNPTNDWMKMFNMNANPYEQWMKSWNNFSGQNNLNQFQMPNGSEFFSNMMNSYNNWYASTQKMFAPAFRMMTPDATKQTIEKTGNLWNMMVQFNIKSGEFQYLTYSTGLKAMQKVAERMQEKVSKGEEFKGMNALYTEWLSVSDKVFVELFESDEYSKLQAEVASLQHNIKKEADTLMEKNMSFIPVITRTEMDDAYKTIHDLKKRVSELEKDLADREETSAKNAKKNTK